MGKELSCEFNQKGKLINLEKINKDTDEDFISVEIESKCNSQCICSNYSSYAIGGYGLNLI